MWFDVTALFGEDGSVRQELNARLAKVVNAQPVYEMQCTHFLIELRSGRARWSSGLVQQHFFLFPLGGAVNDAFVECRHVV